MQLRGPLVGPDRWWYHTLLEGTVRDTLASYGSAPESGPYLFFDQRSSNLSFLPAPHLEPALSRSGLGMKVSSRYHSGYTLE